MTWTSDRSGMASKGVFRSAQMPQAIAKKVKRPMMNRLVALHAINLEIMLARSSLLRAHLHTGHAPHPTDRSLELALGVDQEIRGGHHSLAGRKTGQNLDIALHARAHLHVPRLEGPLPLVDENELFRPAVQERLVRHDETFAKGDLQFYIGVHLRLQLPVFRVGKLEANLHGPGFLLQDRVNVTHLATEDLSGVGGQCHARRLAKLDHWNLVFVDLSLDPDSGKIGHLVQVLTGHHLLAANSHLFDHDPIDGRVNRHTLAWRPCSLKIGDLLVADIPVLKAPLRGIHQCLRPGDDIRKAALGQRLPRSQSLQLPLLGRDQIRTVNGEERLPLLNGLPRKVHQQALDPPLDLDIDVGEASFVELHHPNRPDRPLNRPVFDHAGFQPDQLLSLRADHYRSRGHLHLGRSRRLALRTRGRCRFMPGMIPIAYGLSDRLPRRRRPAAQPLLESHPAAIPHDKDCADGGNHYTPGDDPLHSSYPLSHGVLLSIQRRRRPTPTSPGLSDTLPASGSTPSQN